MLDQIKLAESAIENIEAALRVSANNTANSETRGYKSLKVNFQTVFNRVLSRGMQGDRFSGLGGTNPLQLGGTLGIASTALDWTQGELEGSEAIDIAIEGNGLFIVSPDEGKTLLYTRNGNFQVNAQGFLINDQGMQVYGFPTDSSGNRTSSGIEAIRLSGVNSPGADDNGLIGESTSRTDDSGNITITVTSSRYQIALSSFPNPGGLEIITGTIFRASSASGSPSSPAPPGLNTAVGRVHGARLELSNVFFIGESIDQTALQQAIEANISVVQTINNIIQNIINRLAG